MTRPSSKKVLPTGSPQKRALILCNHIAASQVGDKPLLTDQEAKAFMASFKSDQELSIYNGHRKMFDAVRFYLASIFQWKCSYFESVSRLEKLVVRHINFGHTEDIINLVLSEVEPAKREKLKQRVIKQFSNLSLMRVVDRDDEGNLQIIKPPFEVAQIEELQIDVRKEQVNFKTALAVIKDFLTAKKFNVRLYWAVVREIENWARLPKSTVRLPSMVKMQNLRTRYIIEEDYKKVSIDPELYEQYRRDYLSE